MSDRNVEALGVVLATPGALPPLIWGQPGIGKSARVQQVARALKAELVTVIAAVHEPADFSGYPVPRDGALEFLPASWARRAQDLAMSGQRVVVFFDELSSAPPAVQAALLRVLLERVVGDLELPPQVLMVAAANPTDVAAGGWELADPLANRLVHLHWGAPDAQSWAHGLMNGFNVGPSPVPTFDRQAWEACWARARALVATFFGRVRPELLSGRRSGDGAHAFATPRTVECASRLMASCFAGSREDLMPELVSGCIGSGASTEFLAWLARADLPEPAEVLEDPSVFQHDPARADRTHAVLASVVAYATQGGLPKQEQQTRWHKAWRVLCHLEKAGADLLAAPARTLVDAWADELTDQEQALLARLRKVWAAGADALHQRSRVSK